MTDSFFVPSLPRLLWATDLVQITPVGNVYVTYA